MALSDEKIAEIGEACGLGCKIADAGYPCDMLWFDSDLTQFARVIEAEVRKQDEALIRQCMEALECAGAYTALIDDYSLAAIQEAYKAARARLEGRP